MEKEVIEGAVKICEPIQMKMLDPCFEPWIEYYYNKWKSKELILIISFYHTTFRMWLWRTAVTFDLETVGLNTHVSCIKILLKLQMERECTETNEHYNWILTNEPDSKRAQNVKARVNSEKNFTF